MTTIIKTKTDVTILFFQLCQLCLFCLFNLLSLLPTKAVAQTQSLVSPYTDIVTFKNVTFWGFQDNLDQVFSKPLNQKFTELLSQHTQIDFKSAPAPLDFYNTDPQSLTQKFDPQYKDGALWGEIIKTGKEFRIKLVFIDRNGLTFLQSENGPLRELKIDSLFDQAQELLKNLFASFPYQAWVLGKKQNTVTINFGTHQGAQVGQTLTAVLVTTLKRHPVQNFVTHIDKMPLGQIQIQKVQPNMSFATIIKERYHGAIDKGTFLERDTEVIYPPLVTHPSAEQLESKKNLAPLIVGKQETPWDQVFPEFGRVHLSLGLSQIQFSQNLSSSGGVTASSSLAPKMLLGGELWISPQWTALMRFSSHLATLGQSLQGSTPSELSFQSSQYDIGARYHIALDDNKNPSFFGIGFLLYGQENKISESSPLALTSPRYGGLDLLLDLRLALPDSHLTLQPQIRYPLSSSFAETPVTSGGLTSLSKSEFSLWGEYFYHPLRSALFGLSFEQYQARLSGAGTRSQSASDFNQSQTTLSAGICYYF